MASGLIAAAREQTIVLLRDSGVRLPTDSACAKALSENAGDSATPGRLRALSLATLVATTGGAEDSYRPDSYNRYFFDAFLPPYEQTAALCGMRFLPPLIVSSEQVDDALGRLRAVLS